MQLLNDLEELLIRQGASQVGFCSLDEIPKIKEKGYNLGISIAVAMGPKIIENIKDSPTIEYYNEYQDIKIELNRLRELAANYLNEHGYQAVIEDSFDKVTYTTELPHKTVAVLAGLGWIGKCALLITKEYGSAVLLTSVISSFKYENVNRGPIEVLCNECTKCVENCPGNAIKGQNWRQGVTREEILDFNKCRQAARRIAKETIGIESSFCGRCMTTCPFTIRYIKRMKDLVDKKQNGL